MIQLMISSVKQIYYLMRLQVWSNLCLRNRGKKQQKEIVGTLRWVENEKNKFPQYQERAMIFCIKKQAMTNFNLTDISGTNPNEFSYPQRIGWLHLPRRWQNTFWKKAHHLDGQTKPSSSVATSITPLSVLQRLWRSSGLMFPLLCFPEMAFLFSVLFSIFKFRPPWLFCWRQILLEALEMPSNLQWVPLPPCLAQSQPTVFHDCILFIFPVQSTENEVQNIEKIQNCPYKSIFHCYLSFRPYNLGLCDRKSAVPLWWIVCNFVLAL